MSTENNSLHHDAIKIAEKRVLTLVYVCGTIPEYQKPKLIEAIQTSFAYLEKTSPIDIFPKIKQTRREILDLFELCIGKEHPMWTLVRNRIFTIFGPDGLEHGVNP